MSSTPLALDDDALEQIMRHAQPLQPNDRRPFVETVVQALQDVEAGPGSVQRACREAQAAFLNRATGQEKRRPPVPKYSRTK